MRILLTIHHHMDKNLGAPGVTWNLGQEYEANGHDVSFFAFDQLPSWCSGILASIAFPIFVAIHIMQMVSQNSLDVVVASTGDGWVWAKVFKSFYKKPPMLVTQSHGLEHMMHLQCLQSEMEGRLKLSWKYPIYHGGYRLWEVAQSLRLSDFCFFLNSDDADYAIYKLGVHAERVRVIPNGIPDELLGLPINSVGIQQTNQIKIAHIGSYIPRKGVDFTRQAIASLFRKYENVTIVFLGTGCEVSKVLNDFDSDLHHRIRVLPSYKRSDISDLLKNCHIHLFPTLSEGFGLVLLEAMACGLVPITTKIPGPREIITHEYDGLLIPPQDSQAIEEALERLILDKQLLSKLQANAYRTAQKYSWSKIVKRRLSIYEDSCQSKNLVKV
jgi:glycosyltransferase involved in cell wall biosynthesis